MMRKRHNLLALGLAAAMILTACGGNTPGNSASGGSGAGGNEGSANAGDGGGEDSGAKGDKN